MGKRKVLLVVDDDAEFVAGLRQALNHLVEVVATPFAIEAFGIAVDRRPALTILTSEATEPIDAVISSFRRFDKTSTVVVAGRLTQDQMLAAVRAGAVDFISKPLDARAVIDMSERLLSSFASHKAHRTLHEVKREHIASTLNAAGGNVSEAARRLGVTRTSLQRMLKKLSLSPHGSSPAL